MEKEWIDCGNYSISTATQGSEEWHKLRSGFRITASKFGSAVGHCNGNFGSPIQTALEISGRVKKVFTKEEQERLDFGTHKEVDARLWYEKKYNTKVCIKNIGLAIPKWDKRLGASVDGIVGDGIIEIKSVRTMYGPILNYQKRIREGWIPPKFYHDHIWRSHYDQMQGCMAILEKKWCDYIVYCPSENNVYVQRIDFNSEYWNQELYPKLKIFLEQVLSPLISS
jgi:YqaJ-like viral recombinase domain